MRCLTFAAANAPLAFWFQAGAIGGESLSVFVRRTQAYEEVNPEAMDGGAASVAAHNRQPLVSRHDVFSLSANTLWVLGAPGRSLGHRAILCYRHQRFFWCPDQWPHLGNLFAHCVQMGQKQKERNEKCTRRRTRRCTEWQPRDAARQCGSHGGAAIGELNR